MSRNKDYIIDNYGFKNLLVEKINDSRLTPTMKRTRSGRKQIFREDFNLKGELKRHFANEGDPDVITLRHEKQEYYAVLVEGEWWWANGCYECSGDKKDWMCYSICNKHDVCSKCGVHTSDEKVTTRWGNKNGWVCNICHDREEAIEKAKWQAKIDDDYCSWDYDELDLVKCPWCTFEYDAYESCVSFAGNDKESEEECPKCNNKFTITGHTRYTFTMERDS